MKLLPNNFTSRAYFILFCFFSNTALAGNEEYWSCKYESKQGDKISFSAEYQIAGKKLLGPYSDIAGHRLEYQIIQNNSLGLVAVYSYSKLSDDLTLPKAMGVTIITIRKADGTFKLSGMLVGVEEDDIYLGSCILKGRKLHVK